MRTPQINIGLFGLGTVGGSVYQLLHDNRDLIAQKLGFPLQITKVCDVDTRRRAALNIPQNIFTTKPSDVLDDPEISVIVELIGDRPAALEVMHKALGLAKHVVTANKAILAKHGPELYAEAAKNEVDILFEAAVGGAIPVLRSIREGLIADRILSLQGIINGTANVILTAMAEEKRDFEEALKEAQERGLAEANPTADIEGHDSAHKLAILCALAYGRLIPLNKIFCAGMSAVTPFDLEMADKFGLAIKLLALSKLDGDVIEARIHPTMIPKRHILAQVREAFNAVLVVSEKGGESLYYGLGAGGTPTATAVVADIVEIARNIAYRVPGVPPLGYQTEQMKKGRVKPMDDVECAYYLCFQTIDKPGSLARIATLLGQNNVSISSVHQQGRELGGSVPIVILTHQAREKNILTALREIDRLSVVSEKTKLIRIEQ